MKNADYVMANVFWIGVYPGLGSSQVDHMIDVLHEIAERALRRAGAGVRCPRGHRTVSVPRAQPPGTRRVLCSIARSRSVPCPPPHLEVP